MGDPGALCNGDPCIEVVAVPLDEMGFAVPELDENAVLSGLRFNVEVSPAGNLCTDRLKSPCDPATSLFCLCDQSSLTRSTSTIAHPIITLRRFRASLPGPARAFHSRFRIVSRTKQQKGARACPKRGGSLAHRVTSLHTSILASCDWGLWWMPFSGDFSFTGNTSGV